MDTIQVPSLVVEMDAEQVPDVVMEIEETPNQEVSTKRKSINAMLTDVTKKGPAPERGVAEDVIDDVGDNQHFRRRRWSQNRHPVQGVADLEI